MITGPESIISSVSNQKQDKKILQVEWYLLQFCIYNCSYCAIPQNNQCVILPERLQRTAWHILSYPADAYDIRIMGGEPTLHAYLPNLVNYMLAAPRKTFVTLESTGIQDAEYYLDLHKKAVCSNGNQLNLSFGIHPAFADPSHILLLLARLHDAGIDIKATLVLDRNHIAQTALFHKLLNGLKDRLGLHFSTIDPLLPPKDEARRIDNSSGDNSFPSDKTVWTVTGTNGLKINSLGQFAGLDSKNWAAGAPLWKYDAFPIDQLIAVIPARQRPSSLLFATREAARQWLDEWRLAFGNRLQSQEYFPDPIRPSAPVAHMISRRLAAITPEPACLQWGDINEEISFSCPHLITEPSLLAARQEDISTVFQATKEEESKAIFLESLKAILTGKPACIVTFSNIKDTFTSQLQNWFISPSQNFDWKSAIIYEPKNDPVSFIKDHVFLIRQRKPRLCFKLLQISSKNIIDAPLALLACAPDYELGFYRDNDGQIFFYAWHPEGNAFPPAITWTNNGDNPVFSVIIHSCNNAATIARSIDSALVQSVERLEIIIADSGSTDGTLEICRQYIMRFPKIVRICANLDARNPGKAINAALSQITGKYFTFIEGEDALAADILPKYIEIMERTDAEIVSTSSLIYGEEQKPFKWRVKSGTLSGKEALNAYLHEETGPLERGAHAYSARLIQAFSPGVGLGPRFYEVIFNASLYFHASKAITLPIIGNCQYKKKQDKFALADIVNPLRDICDLSQFVGMDEASDGYRHYIQKLYSNARTDILEDILKSADMQKWAENLPADIVGAVSSSRTFMECMIGDYSELYCSALDLSSPIRPQDLDWRSAASRPLPAKNYTSYGSAKVRPEPVLSIIIPNYNKSEYLPACLNSILSQNNPDYEIIIIDDCSTDGGWEILKDYMAVHPNIRLYRTVENCRQGTCRNIGIREARGKYIAFVDSDDLVENGFFAHGIKTILKHKADIVCFSLRIIKENKPAFIKQLSPQILGREGLIDKFVSGELPPEPYAKIFDREFLLRCHIAFEESVYHQDQYFILRALEAAAKVVTDPFLAYAMVESAGSTMRPRLREYLHIHSACKLYHMLNGMSCKYPERSWNGHIVWNMEKCFLPTIKAFKDRVGEIAISSDDYNFLKGNRLFITSLLSGFAKAMARYRDYYRALPEMVYPRMPERITRPAIHPLVSVIVPVYNQRGLLGRCIRSLLDQYLQDIEVIIINDASTDRTIEVAREFARRDKRVIVLDNQENRGQGWSRTRALKIARGKYVTFVDSDDYVYEFLMHGAAWLERKKDSDFIQFARTEYAEGKTIEHLDYKTAVILEGNEYYLRFLAGKTSWWNAVAKLYRKSFLEKNHIIIPSHLFEDNIFIIQAYSAARNVIVDPQMAYAQVRTPHAASAMRPLQYTPRHLSGYLACAAWISSFVRDNKELEQLNKKDKFLSRIKQVHALPHVLKYVASFKNLEVGPFTADDVANLNSSPELCRELLNDFAALWARYQPAQPGKDDGTQVFEREPANNLIPISYGASRPDPFISVIIPAYNVANYIDHCVRSVTRQATAEVEIVIIEDCSTDSTLDHCMALAVANSNIKLFKTPWNSGLGGARNLGLLAASGNYVTFLDSDDWLDSSFLPEVLRRIRSMEFDVASYNTCSHWGTYQKLYAKPDFSPDSYTACMDHMTGRYGHYSAWGRVFRKQFLLENNILFTKYIYEDVPFMLLAYTLAKSQLYVNEISVHSRRDNTQSIMNTKLPSKFRFISQIRNLVEAFRIFDRYPEHDSEQLKACYLKWQMEPKQIFWNDVLGYINWVRISDLPSPLTDELVNDLTSLRYFMPGIMQKYAEYYIAHAEVK